MSNSSHIIKVQAPWIVCGLLAVVSMWWVSGRVGSEIPHIRVIALNDQRKILGSEARVMGELAGRFRLDNTWGGDAELVLRGVSCGCAKVAIGGRKMAVGDAVVVPGGGSSEVVLMVDSVGQAVNRRLSAAIEVKQLERTEAINVSWDCHVVADLEVVPAVLHVQFLGQEGSEATPIISSQGEVVVRRRHGQRGLREGPPQISGLPAGTEVKSWQLQARSAMGERWTEDRWKFVLSTTVADYHFTGSRRAYRVTISAEVAKGEEESCVLSLLLHCN